MSAIYLLLNVGFLASVTLLWLYANTDTKPKIARRPMLVAFVGLSILTAVFDSLIIASHIVAYNTAHILQIYIGKAPLEDFAYAIGSVILVSAVWTIQETFDRLKKDKRGKKHGKDE